MVEFEPTEEQKLMIDTVHNFAEAEIREKMRDFENQENIDEEIMKKFVELGLALIEFPEEVGGQGLSLMDRILISEELAWGDPGVARALMKLLPAGYYIEQFASMEQAKKYLKKYATEYKGGIAAAIVEEPYHFDPAHFSTSVKKSGDKYIITGKKLLVDFADSADYIVVSAVEENKTGWEGLNLFIVENNDAVKKVKRADKLGLRAVPTYTVEFENLEAGEESLLSGAEDIKRAYITATGKWHLLLTALSIGASRAAFEYSAKYSTERKAFGQPISQFQALAFMVADMATNIDATRLLLWKAVKELDRGNLPEEDISLAVLQSIESGFLATNSSVQILGGHGFIQDHPAEKWMRDVRTISNYIGPQHSFVEIAGKEILEK